MKYDKLVRDKIPEIIESTGKKAIYRILDEAEYKEYLEKKLDEEVAEFHESKSVEELVDILEVVIALAQIRGLSFGDLCDINLKKFHKRGSFSERICLIEVEE